MYQAVLHQWNCQLPERVTSLEICLADCAHLAGLCKEGIPAGCGHLHQES